MALPLSPTAAVETWAEVRARDRVTRYRRAGAGRVVLVLGAAGAGDPLWPELVPTLVRDARVITPQLANGTTDVAAHLLAFLEGLGASDVGVVAADPFCTAALELALLDGGQVTRVVLVCGGAAAGCGAAGAVTTPLREAAVSLLVVGRAAPASDAVARVARFVHGEG